MVCNKDTQSCWQSSKKIHPCCTEKLREMLVNVTNVFDELNIFYWIDFGTLLGAVRHKNIIPWDCDVDLCVMKNVRKRVDEELLPILHDRWGYDCFKNHCGCKVWYSKQNRLFTDIYTWERMGDGFYEHVCKYFAAPIRRFATKFINNFQMINFLGKDFRAPSLAEQKLVRMYGKHWKIPSKKTPYWG